MLLIAPRAGVKADCGENRLTSEAAAHKALAVPHRSGLVLLASSGRHRRWRAPKHRHCCGATLPALPPAVPPSRALSPPQLCQFSSPAHPASPSLPPELSGTSGAHPAAGNGGQRRLSKGVPVCFSSPETPGRPAHLQTPQLTPVGGSPERHHPELPATLDVGHPARRLPATWLSS